MSDKVSLVLGSFHFDESPLTTTILEIEDVVKVDKNKIEDEAERYLSEGVDSYLIPSMYKGEIVKTIYNETEKREIKVKIKYNDLFREFHLFIDGSLYAFDSDADYIFKEFQGV